MEILNENEEIFTDKEFSVQKSLKENEFRERERFYDILLKTSDGTSFKVHKIILSASCNYFDGLFNSDWIESNLDEIQLDLPISANCFKIILKYFYSSCVDPKELLLDEALELHEGAIFFNLENLGKFSAKIIANFIDNNNILRIFQHSVKFLNTELIESCLKHIVEQIDEFFDKYLNDLTAEEFSKFSSSDIFNDYHEKLYSYSTKWITTDFALRKDFLTLLIEKINFLTFSDEFLSKQVLTDERILLDPLIGAKVAEYYKTKLEKNVELPQPSCTRSLKIYSITNKGINKLCFENKRFTTVLPWEFESKFSACSIGMNAVFIYGGINSNKCWFYDPYLNKLQDFAPMTRKKFGHSMIHYDSKIYICGGEHESTIYYCDINTGIWQCGCRMQNSRSDFGIYESNGRIYMIGGMTCRSSSTTVESFDPRELKVMVEANNVEAFGFTRITKNCGRNSFIDYGDTYGDMLGFNSNTKEIIKVIDNEENDHNLNIVPNFDTIAFDGQFYLVTCHNKKPIMMKHEISPISQWKYFDIEFESVESTEFYLTALTS